MRIGIDLGGTKIEAIALAKNGATLSRQRIATPSTGYDDMLAALVQLVADVEAQTGVTGSIGVGIPGAVSKLTGFVKNANSVWLNGKPFERDLSDALQRPVRIANDADCFALSEATDGAGAGMRNVFGIILGTGCGGGIVIDGKLLSGPNSIAGEWGHNPLPWPSPQETPGPGCYCGKHGCTETFLSGPGWAARHFEVSGQRMTAAEIAASASAGDAIARASLEHYLDRLARATASVINILDPDIVVLGGGLSNVDALYAQLPQRWREYVFSDRVDTRLARNKHGDSSGVRGAAWLWPEA